MSRRAVPIPDGVPVLSQGRHWNPRSGACFMEMASFLAGERWSDHPKCTHPVLAAAARCVNDAVEDTTRQRLVLMIPEVVGLSPDDPRVDATLAARCATEALPIASERAQHALAVGLIAAERTLTQLEGAPEGAGARMCRDALADAPEAETWARDFVARAGALRRPLRSHAARRLVALSIDAIAEACVSDAQDRLVHLLRSCVDDTKAFMPPAPKPAPAPAVPWEAELKKRRPELTEH
ncbi:MAG: hypothetical protein L0H79_04120 [Intrasporangium sp.]|uniref:hypothetical protein n=1 Tax=Intrasporangium sp. TaxID=1925024 RepID=UPI002648FE12|nr:hypothetical protein [Intrasporangium sp.]MDN5794917.1 hypothetical protein [Intrasporangium sp.]